MIALCEKQTDILIVIQCCWIIIDHERLKNNNVLLTSNLLRRMHHIVHVCSGTGEISIMWTEYCTRFLWRCFLASDSSCSRYAFSVWSSPDRFRIGSSLEASVSLYELSLHPALQHSDWLSSPPLLSSSSSSSFPLFSLADWTGFVRVTLRSPH